MNTKRMYSPILIVLLTCAALVSSTSCTDIITPILTPKEIIPLKVGNEWNYEVANYLTAFNDTLIRNYSARVVADTMIGNKKHFICHSYSSFLTLVICINLSDGYYGWYNGKYSLGIKYPVRLGDKYQRVLRDADKKPTDTLNITITGLDKQITVKAGTFQCHEEEYYIQPFKYVFYFSAGYGDIQSLIYDGTGTLIARTQLTSYTIQK
jgi:hypothetical protein